jgi:hypothetical protein
VRPLRRPRDNQITIFFKKNVQFFPNFFQFLVVKTLDSELDPDPQLGKMLDPDPHD